MKNVLPILADIANGVFAVYIASMLTSTEIAGYHFVFGILLAMCPDLDAIPELLSRGKIGASKSFLHDHRETLHKPILFIILGTMVYFLNPYWAVLFMVATMLHFINDMYGTGWGVPVFSPFNNDRYKFFTNKDNEPSLHIYNAMRVFKKRDLATQIAQHGDDDWIANNYLKFNYVAVIEYSLFACACVLVLLHFL